MQQPLAVAVMGGLLFSTVFTLWLGPLLYVLVHPGGWRSPLLTPQTSAPGGT
jgi:Cu/Ag efflux pump CusA